MTHSYVGHGLGIELMLCALYLKRFDLTKSLLFDTFCITVLYKLLYARAYYTYTYPCTHTLHMRARASAQECACTAHDAFKRARTDTHAPWHVWADHARTHASAHEHACIHAHAHALRTHAGTFIHALHNAHACIRTRTREHTCTCARTRVNAYIFGCALTDWGHTPQLWFVFRKTLFLFGCLALFVLHSHGLASGGNAGGCGWVALSVSVCGNGAQLETSCWACHAMHEVVALTSSLRQLLAGWRISAV